MDSHIRGRSVDDKICGDEEIQEIRQLRAAFIAAIQRIDEALESAGAPPERSPAIGPEKSA
jgi:hypothetical protein